MIKHEDIEAICIDPEPLTAKVSYRATMQYARGVEHLGDDGAIEKIVDRNDKLNEWPSFVREAFARLYDEHSTTDLDKPSSWGVKAVNALEQQGSWSELRVASSAHRGIATESALRLSDAIADAMGVDKMEKSTAAQVPEEIKHYLDNMRQYLSPEMIDTLEKEITLASARREASLGELQQKLRNGKLASAVAAVAASATEQAEAVKMLIGCGLGSDGATTSDDKIPMDLVKSISGDKRLQDIFKMLGRMREAQAKSALAKTPSAGGEIVGVTTGGDVTKLIGSELAMLGSALEDDVIRRLVEYSASVWETQAQEKRSRGDMVIMLDRSGSMTAYERHVFARALGICALTAAVSQGRNAAVVSFAGRGVVDVAHVRPNDHAALREGIKICTIPASGDTDIIGALAAAKRASSFLKDPDVLLVTDALFPQPPRAVVRGACGQNGRLFVIGLGQGASLSMPDADKLWRIDGVPTLANAADVLAAISEER